VTATVDTVAPDLDGDSDVDHKDFGLFQVCVTGPAGTIASGCESADFDSNNRVDLVDFGIYQNCISGVDVPATEGCDAH
jgi:hypothetical protein